MVDELIAAKGMLLGHRNDVVFNFLEKKIKNSFLVGTTISRHNSTLIYNNISNILFELYQKTGIDLYFDDVDVYDNIVSLTVKYVDDNEEFKINIKV